MTLTGRALRLATVTVGVCAALVACTSTGPDGSAGAGATGIGDAYYPTYGNGGYTVSHYDIDVRYRPDDGRLTGTTTIEATTEQSLSELTLDFLLDTTSVTVDGEPTSSRQYAVDSAGDIVGGELVVTRGRRSTAART